MISCSLKTALLGAMDLAVPAEQLGEKRKRDVNAAIFGYGDELQCNQKLRIAGNTSGPTLVISGRLAGDRNPARPILHTEITEMIK